MWRLESPRSRCQQTQFSLRALLPACRRAPSCRTVICRERDRWSLSPRETPTPHRSPTLMTSTLNLPAPSRPHLHIPLHWELGFQHNGFLGEQKRLVHNILSLIPQHSCNEFLHAKYIDSIPTVPKVLTHFSFKSKVSSIINQTGLDLRYDSS